MERLPQQAMEWAAYFITSDNFGFAIEKGAFHTEGALKFLVFLVFRGERHLPGGMIGVKQMVGFFRKRTDQEVFVQPLYSRIFMGEAQISHGVQTVELFAPAFCQLLTVVDGLSAAAGTAARAGHHFHKVILRFTPPQPQSSTMASGAGCKN